MGPLAGPGCRATLSQDVLPVRLAVLVGFRHRRNGELGLPHSGYSLLGVGSEVSHQSRCLRDRPFTSRRRPSQWPRVSSFPARGDQPPVVLHWYHAKSGPEILQQKGLPAGGNNTLFLGSEGMLLCGFSSRKLYPEEKFADFQAPDKFIPASPGFYREWVDACRGGAPATCNFDYTGPMTETVLLGNVAYRAQGGFDWDADKLVAVGNEAAQRLIRTPYRQGWECRRAEFIPLQHVSRNR
jgi:hypothetical protein